jgi:hypothetical protein
MVFSGQNTVVPVFDYAVRLLMQRWFPSGECYLLLATNFKPLTYQRGKNWRSALPFAQRLFLSK